MMTFKVTLTTVGGDMIGMEMFESRKDADAYVAELLREDGQSVLDSLNGTVPAVSVEVSELCYGTWVTVSKKPVALR